MRTSWFAALSLSILLSGCTQPPSSTGTPDEPLLTSDGSALLIFDDVCLGSAPDFVAAEVRMRRRGLINRLPGGAWADATGAISAKLQTTGSALGRGLERCSVVWTAPRSADLPAMIAGMLAARGIEAEGPDAARLGARTVEIWKFSIDERRARLILAPRGPNGQPGLFLDIAPSFAAA
ncbi:MAG: hypothetical protein AAF334_05570 [Pseudomonadota bacterium]